MKFQISRMGVQSFHLVIGLLAITYSRSGQKS